MVRGIDASLFADDEPEVVKIPRKSDEDADGGNLRTAHDESNKQRSNNSNRDKVELQTCGWLFSLS